MFDMFDFAYLDNEIDEDIMVKTEPSFYFSAYKSIIFNTETDNFDTIAKYIKQYPSHRFAFRVIDTKNEAYGSGATAFAYDKIFRDFVNKHMVITGLYFIDVRTDDEYWSDAYNIEIFVRLIAIMISSNCILPYHLNPILLETISRKPMYVCELKFFMEQLDPETYASCENMSPDDFLDLDCGTVADYYRNRFVGTEKQSVYDSIANYFDLFDSMIDYNICTIDRVFSGIYKIRSIDVLGCCILQRGNLDAETYDRYSEIWIKFVNTLTEIELRQMLYTFGNNYSLEKKYNIYVSEHISKDIVVTTCAKTVTIHKTIFENFDLLLELRHYFVSENSISDNARTTDVDPDINIDSSNSLNNTLAFSNAWPRPIINYGQSDRPMGIGIDAPYWNTAPLIQVMGRARRINSHENLIEPNIAIGATMPIVAPRSYTVQLNSTRNMPITDPIFYTNYTPITHSRLYTIPSNSTHNTPITHPRLYTIAPYSTDNIPDMQVIRALDLINFNRNRFTPHLDGIIGQRYSGINNINVTINANTIVFNENSSQNFNVKVGQSNTDAINVNRTSTPSSNAITGQTIILTLDNINSWRTIIGNLRVKSFIIDHDRREIIVEIASKPIKRIADTNYPRIKCFKNQKQKHARKINNKSNLNRQNKVTNTKYHHKNNLKGRIHQ